MGLSPVCCSSAKHAALWSKKQGLFLAQNEDNMSEWSDLSTHRLLFASIYLFRVGHYLS